MSTRPSLFTQLIGLITLCMLIVPSVGVAQEQSSDEEVLNSLKMPKLKRKRGPKVTEEAAFKLIEGDGRIYFSLISGDDVLLRSPGYATKRAIDEAMTGVIKHIKRVRDMPMRKLDTGEYYFVVVTSRDDVLATSPLYSSREEARDMRARLKRVLIKDASDPQP